MSGRNEFGRKPESLLAQQKKEAEVKKAKEEEEKGKERMKAQAEALEVERRAVNAARRAVNEEEITNHPKIRRAVIAN